jgi:hypothetical protein
MATTLVYVYLGIVSSPRVAPAKGRHFALVQLLVTYKMVTIVFFEFRPNLFATRTAATRLQALLDPRNKPSCLTSQRDMLTASTSVTL